ncbi:MAG: phosphoethanolamine transferase [Flavobacteriaceae bacterium]
MEKLQKVKQVIVFHLLLNITIVFFITGASYIHTPLQGGKDVLIYIFHLCLLQTSLAGAIYFISLFTKLFKVVFSLFFSVGSLFAFWGYTQDLSVTPSLLQSIFETKTDIAIDLLSFPLAVFIIIVVLVIYVFIKFYNKINKRQGFTFFLLPALACLLIFPVLETKRPGSLKNRLPYTIYYSTKQYFEKPDLTLFYEAKSIKSSKDSIKMVFVLGETVRADHLGINGYSRNTTPLLSNRKDIISIPNLYTAYTYTGASVPQILTNKGFEESEGPFISFFSIAKQANYHTSWIGNQTLEKSFKDIVETNHEVLLIDKYKSEFSFSKKLDEEMLPELDSVLKQRPKQLITLHMIGSHWWYENRYRELFRVYTPIIDSKYIPSLQPQEMINSYDNTIVYLDFFLNEVIKKLEDESIPSVMMYVSDHGEYMGEAGKWLHAQGGNELKNPAFLIWFSESYKERYPEKVAIINSLKRQSPTTEIIFPLVLNVLQIEYQFN